MVFLLRTGFTSNLKVDEALAYSTIRLMAKAMPCVCVDGCPTAYPENPLIL